MIDTMNTVHSPTSRGRWRGRVTTSLLALAWATTPLGCDREAKKAAGGTPAAETKQVAGADAKVTGTKAAGADTKVTGTKAAGADTKAARPSPELLDMAVETPDPPTPQFQRIWLKWDGSAWTYYAPTTASGSEPTDPNDPPPSDATWATPQGGKISFNATSDTIVRALVHNTTGANIHATFQSEGPLAASGSKTVAFSERFASYDDWDFSIPPGDPVFHIKRGSTGSGTTCANATLTYAGGADPWSYTPAGGSPQPIGAAMTCHYDSGSGEFDITLANGTSASKTFKISQTRPVGLSPSTVPWNNTAWEIGFDTHLDTTWAVFVVGHETTSVELELERASPG